MSPTLRTHWLSSGAAAEPHGAQDLPRRGPGKLPDGDPAGLHPGGGGGKAGEGS